MRILPVFLALLAAAPAVAQPVSPDAGRVYELNEVEVLPRPQNAAEFVAALQQAYPLPMRQAGVGGTVHVSFVLGPNGQPGDVRVLSTPDSSFEAPTVQAVSLLRFTPAQVQGRPVPVRVEQPITWRVDTAAVAVADESSAPASTDVLEVADVLEGAAKVYELSEVEELPDILNVRDFQRALRSEHPRVDSHPGRQAEVQVRFRVHEDGSTSHATITRSTDQRFNTPTLRAVRVLRFRPARVEGRPVKVWVEQPISWSLVMGIPGWQDTENGSTGNRARRLGSPTFTTPSSP
ncbi:MAG TPA: TonB family protein [Longimicrobium sp.]|nr:TonB family protein [Longimicrobium sp.]